ncbi:MAG: DHH family phosphoesterase [Candidatus Promineifilaceae bacterium]|nr:DHH family phosphoesterase [Candidatus Promineifilaceae bacterium]
MEEKHISEGSHEADSLNQFTVEHYDQSHLDRLREIVGKGPVLILTHDNPDPDALASGKAFATLLNEAWNVPSHLVYSGLVLRAENRALLRLLTPEWEHSDILADLDHYSAVAMLDTQPGAGNNRLPDTYSPQIVIDHHQPLRQLVSEVPFVDVNPKIGATVTLLAQYMEIAGVEPDENLATAMFYGLKTDTRSLSRGTSNADIRVYLALLARINHQKLIQVEQAGLSQEFFQAFSQGLQAAQIYEHSVVAILGSLYRPDLSAEIADILIRLENTKAVLCLGVHNQTLYLSVRSVPMGEDAGALVQQIIIPPGKAGGHGTMAGGQLPLTDERDPELENHIVDRFLAIMGETRPGIPLV